MNAKEWVAELQAAKKREEDWRKNGKEILSIYDGGKKVAFNIVYSNTETILPSLYSALPRPLVSRRFKDDDPVAAAASMAGTRALEFLLDTNVEGYETYDEGVRAAVLDALLPGRGVTSVKYDAKIVEAEPGEEPEVEDADEMQEQEPLAYKAGELVCLDSCKWDEFLHGYAKKWSKVPWVAFGKDIDKREATERFGRAIASRLTYSDEKDPEEGRNPGSEDRGAAQTTRIWVVWDKADKKVRFVSEHYCDAFLQKAVDDPLGVTGFFPIPKPLTFVEKSNDLSVTALYDLYKKQAEELNKISERIIKLVGAIRARGVYDGELGDDLAKLMEAADNELVPADKSASLAAEKGLSNAIWWMPIDMLVNTLRELYTAREACKAVIWEIMGIADIMRGVSQASETLGAQEMKAQWGSLRLKRMQKEVQRYCRDLLRIMLEVAANKFSEDTWAKMTGLPYLTAPQAEMAQQRLQMAQAGMRGAQARMQMQPQPPAAPNQPPPPNPMMQQAQQELQAAQAEAGKPKWADVIALLKDDLQRSYKIDIETNSTLEAEATEDKKDIAELMNAIAQFLNGIGPLIDNGTMPFDAAKTMLMATVKRFRFGREIEDQIGAMQPPQQNDDGTQAKMKMEQEKHQAEMAAKQGEQQARQSEMAMKAKLEQQKAANDQRKMAMEMEAAEKEHQFKMAELAAKTQMAEVVNSSKIKVAMATAAAKERAAATQPQGAPQ